MSELQIYTMTIKVKCPLLVYRVILVFERGFNAPITQGPSSSLDSTQIETLEDELLV